MTTDRRKKAIHEAGHAIVAYVLGIRLESATIVPGTTLEGLDYEGIVISHSAPLNVPPANQEEHDQAEACVILDFAGIAAEEGAGLTPAGHEHDLGMVMRRRWLLDRGPFVDDDAAILAYLDSAEFLEKTDIAINHAQRIVTAHWPQLAAIATALLEQDTLTPQDVRHIIDHTPVERPIVSLCHACLSDVVQPERGRRRYCSSACRRRTWAATQSPLRHQPGLLQQPPRALPGGSTPR